MNVCKDNAKTSFAFGSAFVVWRREFSHQRIK